MKWFFSILFFLIFLNIPDVYEIRKIYPKSSNSENYAKELFSKLSVVTNESNKTLVAYKGASIAIMSKFAKKISEKMSNFKEGAKLIEFAVVCEPNNVEIRLIRLSIQENAPKIVGYNKNKKDDTAFLLNHYKEQSNSLKEYTKSFILQSKSFTEQEKQALK